MTLRADDDSSIFVQQQQQPQHDLRRGPPHRLSADFSPIVAPLPNSPYVMMYGPPGQTETPDGAGMAAAMAIMMAQSRATQFVERADPTAGFLPDGAIPTLWMTPSSAAPSDGAVAHVQAPSLYHFIPSSSVPSLSGPASGLAIPSNDGAANENDTTPDRWPTVTPVAALGTSSTALDEETLSRLLEASSAQHRQAGVVVSSSAPLQYIIGCHQPQQSQLRLPPEAAHYRSVHGDDLPPVYGENGAATTGTIRSPGGSPGVSPTITAASGMMPQYPAETHPTPPDLFRSNRRLSSFNAAGSPIVVSHEARPGSFRHRPLVSLQDVDLFPCLE